MVTLKDATELTIENLLEESYAWSSLIFNLEEFACFRGYLPGMEKHHIEPERERTVYLWPLEHLAIHIAHAKLSPTNSNHAKVAAFVKPFPGAYRRMISLHESLKCKVVRFGVLRPETNTPERMKEIANLPQSKEAQRENGRRVGAVTGPITIVNAQNARRGSPCTWGDKISAAIEAKGFHVCPHCGREMKNIASNILQHERSSKCKRFAPNGND
jgi:ribulose bisphosphate carboxylase small subunit